MMDVTKALEVAIDIMDAYRQMVELGPVVSCGHSEETRETAQDALQAMLGRERRVKVAIDQGKSPQDEDGDDLLDPPPAKV